MVGPEDKAREEIDSLLDAAGWHVCDFGAQNISEPCAVREFPLKSGHGHADYLLYLHGKAVGVVEAKKVGHTFDHNPNKLDRNIVAPDQIRKIIR